MEKRTRTILLVITGLCIFVVIVGVAAGVWFFVSVFESAPADEVTAERSFIDVRERFGGVTPVVEMRDREIVLLREPPDAAPSREINTVHMLVWDPEDQSLVTLDMPMWLLRMSDDPIELSAGRDTGTPVQLSMTVAEMAQYGSTILLDHEDEDGERVLVWTD